MGPSVDLGGSFISLYLWRLARSMGYRLVGLIRPGWRNALHVLRVLDRYTDEGTGNVAVYSDPRFEVNIRALERELRRLRAGGHPREVEVPHDFPPGSKSFVRQATATSS